MTRRLVSLACLVVAAASPAAAADRAAELATLLAEFEAAQHAFFEAEPLAERTAADKIATYKSYPRWTFLPKILAIAKADPSDHAALAASKWIVEQNDQMGPQWGPMFEADRTAWGIIQKHELSEEQISRLCLQACSRQTSAREAFLRGMAARTDLPGDARAFAQLALAEYLADRTAGAEDPAPAWWTNPNDEYMEFLSTQLADQWVEYSTVADAEPVRAEATALFRQILADYAAVPVTFTAPGFRDLKTIGDKARKSLHALEHLRVGLAAPGFDARDLEGKPLRLADYRGKVVVLSFWFTGCGPCMEAVPTEQALIKRFRDQPFALIGVCRDNDPAMGRATAQEHGMTWPSIDDGRPGPVTDAYNVLSWPTFYVIDADGTIAVKDASLDTLEETIARLIAKAQAPSP